MVSLLFIASSLTPLLLVAPRVSVIVPKEVTLSTLVNPVLDNIFIRNLFSNNYKYILLYKYISG